MSKNQEKLRTLNNHIVELVKKQPGITLRRCIQLIDEAGNLHYKNQETAYKSIRQFINRPKENFKSSRIHFPNISVKQTKGNYYLIYIKEN